MSFFPGEIVSTDDSPLSLELANQRGTIVSKYDGAGLPEYLVRWDNGSENYMHEKFLTKELPHGVLKSSLTKRQHPRRWENQTPPDYCQHRNLRWECETCRELHAVQGLAARAKSAAALRKRVVAERRLVARLERQLTNARDNLITDESRLERLLNT